MENQIIKFTNTLANRKIFLPLTQKVQDSISKNFPNSKILELKEPKVDKKGNSFFGCRFNPNPNSKTEKPIDVIINTDHEVKKRVLRLMIIDPMTGYINQASDLDDNKSPDEILITKELEQIEDIFEKDLEELKLKHDKAA